MNAWKDEWMEEHMDIFIPPLFYSRHIDGNKKNNEKTREEVKSAS